MTDDGGAIHIATILARSPTMADFKIVSSRVGISGGVALAEALAKGEADSMQRGAVSEKVNESE
jgi:hypothetical protein